MEDKLMYYYETCYRQIGCQSGLFSRMDGYLRRGVEVLGAYLKIMVTPEPSGAVDLITGRVEPRWLGVLKTLFWAGNSVIIGIILATVCN